MTSSGSPAAPQGCVAPEAIVAVLERRATTAERAEVERHLDACVICRQTMAAVASLAHVDPSLEPAVSPGDPLVPGDMIGRYELVAPIGRGGMGSVWAARDPELKRSVAIKIPGEQVVAAQHREAWLAEARAMARIDHPHVVVVLDSGIGEHGVFIAMEHFAGTTLRAWLAKERPVADVLSVMRRAGEGLCAAHAAGIVHRDFKPDNVLVSDEDHPARVGVTDFGLAVTERTLSSIGLESTRDDASAPALAGTLPYMAPEQLAGERVTAAADQFAFCVTLWEALFGARPFQGTTPAELLAAMRDPVPMPAREVPRWLRAALRKGLSMDPQRRHASMRALLDRLRPPASRRVLVVPFVLAGALVTGFALLRTPSSAEPPSPPPTEPRAGSDASSPPEAIAARVLEIRDALDRADALFAAGDRDGALALASAQLDAADALGWPPLRAEAMAVLAPIVDDRDVPRGERLLEDALAIAEAHGMDALAAKIQVYRVYLVGHAAGRPEVALDLARGAEAAITRIGGDAKTTAKLHYHVAGLLRDAGRTEEADARATLGLAVLDALADDDPLLRSNLLHIRGTARLDRDATAEGLADLELAVATSERALGRSHPSIDVLRYAHARAVSETGQLERALEMFESIHADRIAREGPLAESVAATHSAIGVVLRGMNRLEEAAARQKACVDVWDALPLSPKPEAGMCMLNLGHTYSQLLRCDEAASWLARARDEITRTAGGEHVLVANTWGSLGMCAHETGDLDTAADAYAKAIATADDVEPPHTRGMIRLYLAQVLKAKGEVARARAIAVEARAILATHTDPTMVAEADALLATLGDAATGTGD